VQSSTGKTPLFILYGKHLRTFELHRDKQHKGEVPGAVDRLTRMQTARKELEQSLKKAQEYQQRYYNKHYQPHSFKKGDRVLLSTRNLSFKDQVKKLSDKFAGPFTVEGAVGTQAYRLWLPPTWQVHNVFHVSLLKPYHHRNGDPIVDHEEPEL